VFWKIEEANIAAFTRVISAPLFHEFGEKTNIDFGLSHCIEKLQPNIVELIMKHCNTRAVLTNYFVNNWFVKHKKVTVNKGQYF
jgi:hypothetical protein